MHPLALIDAIPWTMPAASDALFAAFRALSPVAASTIATAFWQGALVASGLAICLRLAPRMPAAQRFAVWAAGFATLIALPFTPLLSHLPGAASNAVPIGTALTASKPWLQLDMRWSLAIAAIWLAASVFRAADFAMHSFRLRKLWKTSMRIDSCASATSLQSGPSWKWRRRRAQICSTKELDRPSVIGFFAPRILIPAWLLAQLTPEELQQVVLHEAEHLRRGDDWTNLFQKLGLVLFPLNPALWWIERRLCQEREMACDDGVVRATRAPRAYATCLASLAERGMQRRAEALSLGAWQRRSELVQRVHRILRHRNTLHPFATRSLLGVLGCGLLFGSVELARCPQLIAFVPAQDAEHSQTIATMQAPAEPAQLINAASTPVRKAASATHGFRAIQSRPHAAYNAQARGTFASYDAAEGTASASVLASGSPKRMTKVAFADSPSAPVSEPQWIVLTAWQQVQTASSAARPIADYDTGEITEQPSGQVTSQITVTRLIFKILPAGSTSAQPAAVPVRSDWFVIQL